MKDSQLVELGRRLARFDVERHFAEKLSVRMLDGLIEGLTPYRALDIEAHDHPTVVPDTQRLTSMSSAR